MRANNEKTKVLFIEYAQGFGGSIVSLSESLKGMSNIEPYVLVLQNDKILDKLYSSFHLIKKPLIFNYLVKTKYTELLQRLLPYKFLAQFFLLPFVLLEKIEAKLLLRSILKIIKKEDIKLVYSNNGFNESTILSARAAGLPCTLHFRGYKQTSYPFENTDYHYPSLFFAISHYVKNYLINSGVPKDHIFMIHNAVEVKRYELAYEKRTEFRKKLLDDEDTIAIGIFGRITEWKGQKDFISAIDILVNQTNIKFKVFVVGDCSDEDCEYYEQLKVTSRHLVESNKLVFCGYQRAFENYYAAMDIVVHASRNAEPFGRVVIEGMAAKAAVIAMNEGGPSEVITDGVDGLLVEPRSIDKLVEALIILCESKELRQQLSENAIKTVKEKYSPEYVGGEIEKQLLTVINNFN